MGGAAPDTFHVRRLDDGERVPLGDLPALSAKLSKEVCSSTFETLVGTPAEVVEARIRPARVGVCGPGEFAGGALPIAVNLPLQ
ncbi:MAG: hypothetical protein M3063_11910 [Actinomycetota bacterium]|nr:hypothetical protein [Actinomycetota bacterium]